MAASEPMLTPNDLRDASGLSPRQVNDWDSRGALPNDRDGERGHRRFTPQQVFAISVCAAIKRDFGVPVERLAFVSNWLLDVEEDDNDFLNYAARLMTERGLGVWLCTDFTEMVLVLTEMDFADLWKGGYFAATNERSFAFLNLNPIVNKIVTAIGRSPIESHNRYRDLVMSIRDADRARPDGERDVLEMIRSGRYQEVRVTSPDGEVHTITAVEFLGPDADVAAVLDAEDFQTVTTQKRGGKIVGHTRTITKQPRPQAPAAGARAKAKPRD